MDLGAQEVILWPKMWDAISQLGRRGRTEPCVQRMTCKISWPLKGRGDCTKNTVVALKVVATTKIIHLSWWIWMVSLSQIDVWGISSDTVSIASVLIKSGTCMFRFCLAVFHYVPWPCMCWTMCYDRGCPFTEVILWQTLSFLIIITDTFYKAIGFMMLFCLWQTVVKSWTAWLDFTGDCKYCIL